MSIDENTALAKALLLRVREARAGQLVATVVLRTFLSFFPLLLTAIGVLGFVAARRAGGTDDLGNRIVRQLKLSGDLARLVQDNLASARSSRKASSIVGAVSLAFSGTAVFMAVAQMCNALWQVPERGLRDRVLGVVWFVGAAIFALGSAVATAAVRLIPIPGLDVAVGIVGASVTGALLFWWTQVIFTNAPVPRRAFVPGAIVGGFALAAFQLFGAYLVTTLLAQASALYKSLAAVIALLGVLTLFAWLLLLSVAVNVLRWERDHGTVTLEVQAPRFGDPVGESALGERGGQRPRPIRQTDRGGVGQWWRRLRAVGRRPGQSS